jgi:hypothetical protein
MECKHNKKLSEKNKTRYKLRILDFWDVTLHWCGSSSQHFDGNVSPLFSGLVAHFMSSMSFQNVITTTTCPVMQCHILEDQNRSHCCENLKTDKIKAIKS